MGKCLICIFYVHLLTLGCLLSTGLSHKENQEVTECQNVQNGQLSDSESHFWCMYKHLSLTL